MKKTVKINFSFSAIVEMENGVHVSDLEEIFSLPTLWATVQPLHIKRQKLNIEMIHSKINAVVNFINPEILQP